MEHNNFELKKSLFRVSSWNYVVGFITLILYLFVSYIWYKNSEVFGIFASLYFGVVLLNYAIGLLFIFTGSYLRSVQGKHTRKVLWITIFLSAVSIFNILPAINLVLAIIALRKDSKSTGSPQSLSTARFFLLPANVVAVVLFIIVSLFFVGTIINSDYFVKDDGYNDPKVSCDKISVNPCKVENSDFGFSVVFPSAPDSSGYTGTKMHKSVTYALSLNKNGTKLGGGQTVEDWRVAKGSEYLVFATAQNSEEVLPVQSDSATLRNFYIEHPAFNPVRGSSFKCSTSSLDTPSEVGFQNFKGYKSLVAVKIESIPEGSCYHKFVAIPKGKSVYTISSSSLDDTPEQAKMNVDKFIDTFELTN